MKSEPFSKLTAPPPPPIHAHTFDPDASFAANEGTGCLLYYHTRFGFPGPGRVVNVFMVEAVYNLYSRPVVAQSLWFSSYNMILVKWRKNVF